MLNRELNIVSSKLRNYELRCTCDTARAGSNAVLDADYDDDTRYIDVVHDVPGW